MPQPGYIALLGSGELSESMAEAHRNLMARLGEAARPVFVDTPAGFELNIQQIGQKAGAYFSRNFNMELEIAHYRTGEESPADIATAIATIQKANYLFAGPGSPSYAIRTWQNSAIWQAMLKRWQEGAMLVFSSAAAVTIGACSIPVYEIYKVGEALHWISGLDVLGMIGLRATVVPHWNNNSGDQHDTTCCFMGQARFARLESVLPDDVFVIGVDEYTGLLIDPTTRSAEVFGPGQVVLRRHNHQLTYGKTDRITFDANIDSAPDTTLAPPREAEPEAVQGNTDVEDTRRAVQAALQTSDLNAAVQGLIALGLIAGAGLEQGIYNRAESAVQALQGLLPSLLQVKAAAGAETAFLERETALMELLMLTRAELRSAKQWAAADAMRNQLTALGYLIADTPQGSTWQRAS